MMSGQRSAYYVVAYARLASYALRSWMERDFLLLQLKLTSLLSFLAFYS